MTTLKDVLSHLKYRSAVKLLGPDGVALLRKGGKMQVDLEEQVILADDLFTLFVEGSIVTIAQAGPGS